MKNNLGPSRRGKGAAVGLVICFVAVIALVGFFTFSRYKRDMSRQLAKAEEKTDTEENQKDIKETNNKQSGNSEQSTGERKTKRRNTNTDRSETDSDLTNGNTARCTCIFRK